MSVTSASMTLVSCRRYRGAGGRLGALVDDLAAAGDAGAGDHLVLEVERQLALVVIISPSSAWMLRA